MTTKLRKSNELSQKIHCGIDNAHDAVYWLDCCGRIEYINAAAAQGLGYSKEELQVCLFSDITEEVSEENWPSFWQRIKQQGYLLFETELLSKKGHFEPVEVTASYVNFNGKENIYALVRYIADRKKAELKHRKFLQDVLGALKSHIAVLDKKGKIIAVNATWRQFWRENRVQGGSDRWLGRSFFTIFDGISDNAGIKEVTHGVNSVLAGKWKEFETEYSYHTPLKHRWFKVSATPLMDDTGGAVVAYHDITKQKEMEQTLRREKEEQKRLNKKLHETHKQLLQSEKMASIGQLAAGVAHEINNPVGYINSNLGSLQGYVKALIEIVEAYESLDEAMDETKHFAAVAELKDRLDISYLKQDSLDLILESKEGISRVKKIVQDLKDFSHVEDEGCVYSDLHAGINSTLNIVHNELKYKAEVIKNFGELPPVECIISQLNQVFMNLLVNASQAIEEQGRIRITTRQIDADWVQIEIEDSGIGIPKEQQQRIFEPFFTTKPVGQGTGLGLSLSYSIIEKHGGHIELESGEGCGTVFRLLIPIKQARMESVEVI